MEKELYQALSNLVKEMEKYLTKTKDILNKYKEHSKRQVNIAIIAENQEDFRIWMSSFTNNPNFPIHRRIVQDINDPNVYYHCITHPENTRSWAFDMFFVTNTVNKGLKKNEEKYVTLVKLVKVNLISIKR
jgi:hypothetical protein